MGTYRSWLVNIGIPADIVAHVVANATDNTTYYDFLKGVPEELGVVAEAYRHEFIFAALGMTLSCTAD